MSRQKPGEAGTSEGARRASGEASASPTRATGRWSARRKMSVVLELLRGADLETLSRRHGVTAARISEWRDAFLAGGEAHLITTSAVGGGVTKYTIAWTSSAGGAVSGNP